MPIGPPFVPAFPFYTGGGPVSGSITEQGDVRSPVPNTVSLDGYTFSIELNGDAQWRSGPLDTFRDTIVGSGQLADDSLFSARGAWARYRFSWHHGSGQSLGDFDPEADGFRFLNSYGIKWNTKYQATLQPSTTNNRTVASATPVLCRSDIYIFASDGANLYRTTDMITWTAMTAPGGNVQAMTSDGTDLYVATSTGAVKYIGAATVPTAFATPVAGNCTNIAFCSNRLLLAKTNALFEVPASGVLGTAIKTHFQAAFSWTTIFNIGSRIYIGGFAGSRSELHTVTTDSAGSLVQSQEAAPLPANELLRAGVSYAGAAVLCTSNGLRVAQVSGDGTLTYGPLIDELGDVRCAFPDGRHVFAGWSAMTATKSGIARLVMDDEVQPLQPAYGAEVSESTLVAAVTGIARLSGRTCFAVAGSGIWVESATAFETAGRIESGRMAFGTVEPKGLVSATLTFAPLLASQVVSMTLFDDNGTNIGSASQTTVGATSLVIDLVGAQVSFTTVRIDLSGDGTNTPTLQRWRLRAYPIPPLVLQWVLPLIVHELVTVNIGEGQDQSYNLEDVHGWIEALVATRRLTVLRVGTRTYRVRVDTFEWHPRKWTDDGGGPQGLLVVQLIST